MNYRVKRKLRGERERERNERLSFAHFCKVFTNFFYLSNEGKVGEGLIRQPSLHLVAHRQAGSQAGRRDEYRFRFLVSLLGGNLCSLAGDGVLHGLQLLQQLLAAGQRVARLAGPGARAGAGGSKGGTRDARLAARWRRARRPARAFSRRGFRRRRQGTFPLSLGGHGSGALAPGPLHSRGRWGAARYPLVSTSVWRHGHPLAEGRRWPLFV